MREEEAGVRGDDAVPLAERRCRRCRPGDPPLPPAQIERLAEQVPGWAVVGGVRLVKEVRFPDFRRALAWVNAVSEIAEREGHHPELEFTWGRARASLWTHAIGGLTENDFILAAMIERIPVPP